MWIIYTLYYYISESSKCFSLTENKAPLSLNMWINIKSLFKVFLNSAALKGSFTTYNLSPDIKPLTGTLCCLARPELKAKPVLQCVRAKCSIEPDWQWGEENMSEALGGEAGLSYGINVVTLYKSPWSRAWISSVEDNSLPSFYKSLIFASTSLGPHLERSEGVE